RRRRPSRAPAPPSSSSDRGGHAPPTDRRGEPGPPWAGLRRAGPPPGPAFARAGGPHGAYRPRHAPGAGVDRGGAGAYPPTSRDGRTRGALVSGGPAVPRGCAVGTDGLAWSVAVRLWSRLADSSSGFGAPAHSRLVPGLAMACGRACATRFRADRTH